MKFNAKHIPKAVLSGDFILKEMRVAACEANSGVHKKTQTLELLLILTATLSSPSQEILEQNIIPVLGFSQVVLQLSRLLLEKSEMKGNDFEKIFLF